MKLEQKIISGIQQIGIGVPDVHEAWAWYRAHFGMDIPVFEEAAEAALMLPYTGGEPRSRHAVLAINLQGGGGMEIWQYTSRTPQPPATPPQLGDLGIFMARIKCRDVAAAHKVMQSQGVTIAQDPVKDPADNAYFIVQDPYGNYFQVHEQADWFSQTGSLTGGPSGCMIGVTDIERARTLYADILGYDLLVYDEEGIFPDLTSLPGGGQKVRRVLLTHQNDARKGAFSRMLGHSSIELISVKEGSPRQIFADRFWGDLGFIHLCFDIVGMDVLRQECEDKGFPFTVDSTQALGGDFDMGEASGRFSYIEDPDGTLIEFVETLKLPIIKKVGWYLDLRNRNPYKALPDWMLKSMRFNRVRS